VDGNSKEEGQEEIMCEESDGKEGSQEKEKGREEKSRQEEKEKIASDDQTNTSWSSSLHYW
jgi:hypothetical protein